MSKKTDDIILAGLSLVVAGLLVGLLALAISRVRDDSIFEPINPPSALHQ